MRKLNLAVPEREQIEINGIVFDINLSDSEIINKVADFKGKFGNLKSGDIQNVRLAVNFASSLIDEILGEGATNKISGGLPVSAGLAVNWLTAICNEAARSSEKYINERYE